MPSWSPPPGRACRKSLLNQLADGGRMVLPVGERGDQVLELWRRDGEIVLARDPAPRGVRAVEGKGWGVNWAL